MKPLYKNADTKLQVMAITRKLRGHILGEIRDHYLATSYGETYVMESGDASLPTVIVLHGGMTNHAFIMYFLRELVGRFHVICPDMPGHAGFSTEARIDPRGDGFGHWLIEVMDALGIESADFVGTSYGGFVANRVIALAPERVRKAALIVPAGIIGMSRVSLVRHMLGWQIAYAVTGFEFFFRKLMDAFFTDYDDVDVREFFRLTLTGMRIDTRQMKLSSPEQCRSFDRPVYVIGSERDVVFNCKALQARVGELYPHARFDILQGSKHSPSIKEENLASLNGKIIRFLEGRDKSGAVEACELLDARPTTPSRSQTRGAVRNW